MTQSPIFLTPVCKEKIWGGTALRDRFGYGIPSESTGNAGPFPLIQKDRALLRMARIKERH